MVQWLRLHASHARTQVKSLVGELRSHMLCSEVKKKKKQNKNQRARSVHGIQSWLKDCPLRVLMTSSLAFPDEEAVSSGLVCVLVVVNI